VTTENLTNPSYLLRRRWWANAFAKEPNNRKLQNNYRSVQD